MAQEPSKPSNEEITCREVVAWTSAYLDEHVGEDRQQEIALHLACCAGCGAYVKQIASVRDLVRLLPKSTEVSAASEPLREAFADRFRKGCQ
jgi:predicted anti-sigma-YlaC factor YlaD